MTRRTFPPAPTHPDVLVLDAHPAADSFSRALSAAWIEGAADALPVEHLVLADLTFEPHRSAGYTAELPLEPDLQRARDALARCAHLVVTYPVWWGSTPAVLKGFFDRVLLPGWAFAYEGGWPVGGLAGRSARQIVTMDAPVWYDQLVYRGSARRQVGRATLGFCGFAVKTSAFGSIGSSTATQRSRMLARARRDGAADAVAVRRRFPARRPLLA
jgi:putative NADPH-quinone reductase